MRTRLGGGLVVVAALGLVLGAAAPASAHNYLVSSTPAENETLTELPEEFAITTNDALLDLSGTGSGFALQVIDAEGLYYGDGCVEVEGASVYTPAAIGGPGEYTLAWQVVSADGHTISDEFTFEWAGEATAEGTTSAPTCGEAAVSESAAPEADASAGAQDETLSTILWIGGAILLVAAAIVVTLVILGRRSAPEES